MITRHARIGGPTDALNHPQFDQVYKEGRSGAEICKEKHYFHMLERRQSLWLKDLFRRAEALTAPDPKHRGPGVLSRHDSMPDRVPAPLRDQAANSVPIKKKGGKR